VSFISVTLILPALIGRLSREADLVVLVKPQFEAGRGQVGKGGIVRDETIRQAAVEKVRQQLGELGFQRVEAMPSPILGAEGNQEFLLFASERA
jgi:23S rRNA (cytidine1920-2'-O)/16S rRNA (cytidine1409-2'-O)-methyltransferase